MKKDIKQETQDKMEKTSHLKHIEVHQRIANSIRLYFMNKKKNVIDINDVIDTLISAN